VVCNICSRSFMSLFLFCFAIYFRFSTFSSDCASMLPLINLLFLLADF
jgi:hypothetical protein